MKWRAKPKPKHGDSRIAVRFAWLPIRTNADMWVWFKWVYVKLVFETIAVGEFDEPYWRTETVYD